MIVQGKSVSKDSGQIWFYSWLEQRSYSKRETKRDRWKVEKQCALEREWVSGINCNSVSVYQ